MSIIEKYIMHKLMIRLKLSLFMLTVFCCSCDTDCNIDKEFKAEFDNCILLVERIHQKGYSSELVTRAYTFECLFAVTGYEGYVDKSNEPHCFYPYSDTIDYIKIDIQRWRKWYELNKCTMTMVKADSLIAKHAKEYGIPDLNWPPPADKAVKYEE